MVLHVKAFLQIPRESACIDIKLYVSCDKYFLKNRFNDNQTKKLSYLILTLKTVPKDYL